MPTRKVYFYRIHAGLEEDGRPVAYDLGPALRHIDGLPFAQDGRYAVSGDDVTCCWVDRDRAPQRVRLGRIRRAELPQVERAGRLEDLNLPDDAGLAEQTHVMLFPPGIAGVLFNFYGPRASSLAAYLREKHPPTPRELRLDPLLRHDVLAQLERLGEVRVLDLNISRSFIDTIRDCDESLGAAFDAASRAGRADQVQLVLKPPRYRRDWLWSNLLQSIRRIAASAGLREQVHTFRVKGLNTETGNLETIDVLHDQLVASKEVTRQRGRTRALRPESAYGAIDEAYEELREELEHAATITGI